MIDLRNTRNEDLLASLRPGEAVAVHADPAWGYSSGKSGGSGKSAAHDLYQTQSMDEIRQVLDLSARVVGRNAYLVVWCTFPLLGEWFSEPLKRWRYLSGGSWGKTNGAGMGYHLRGDSEVALLYRKGKPRPSSGPHSNSWPGPRRSHSEKPQEALRPLLQTIAPEGGLVVDLWAGETGSCARACAATGRRYLGAELCPDRHARALRRIAGDSAAQARGPREQLRIAL